MVYFIINPFVFNHYTRTEWDFIYGLPYQDQCGDDADLFRSLYIIKLKKVRVV
jgi:hypothetical protein